MPVIHVYLDREVYEKLKRLKGHLTWAQFLAKIAEGRQSKPEAQASDTADLADLEARISRLETQMDSVIGELKAVRAILFSKKRKEEKREEDEEMRPATQKQIKYIWDLMRKTGTTVMEIEKEFGVDMSNVSLGKEELPKEVASKIIDWLKERAKSAEPEGEGEVGESEG